MVRMSTRVSAPNEGGPERSSDALTAKMLVAQTAWGRGSPVIARIRMEFWFNNRCNGCHSYVTLLRGLEDSVSTCRAEAASSSSIGWK